MIRERILEKWERLAIEKEGYENTVYKDTLGNLTVGIGHLLIPEDKLKEGEFIEDDLVEKIFENDTSKIYSLSLKQAVELGKTSDFFILALMSANFQLGNFAAKFDETFSLLKKEEWEEAIKHLENSLWMRQTPIRANDFIDAIKKVYRLPWWKRIFQRRK